MRRRIKSAALPAVKTEIKVNKETGKHEVHVSMDGKNYRQYKTGLSIDAATKESQSLKGHFRLWNDIIDNKK